MIAVPEPTPAMRAWRRASRFATGTGPAGDPAWASSPVGAARRARSGRQRTSFGTGPPVRAAKSTSAPTKFLPRRLLFHRSRFPIPRSPVTLYLEADDGFPSPGASPRRATLLLRLAGMIREMREKLGKEIEELSRELTLTLPQAIATAVAMGDLRENSEYKAALERQQLVQARLGQLHQRLAQLAQLANTEAPRDRVGLGSRVVVEDVAGGDPETYTVVLAEMMDIDAGHISMASPLGQALKDRKPGEEVSLRLPTMTRKLRVIEVVTVHDQAAP